MKRLFSIAAVFSLLLWLVLFAAWVRSLSGRDNIWFSLSGRLVDFSTGREFDIVIAHDWSQPESLRWTRQGSNRSADSSEGIVLWINQPQPNDHVVIPGLQVYTVPHASVRIEGSRPVSGAAENHNILIQTATSDHRVTIITITSWFMLLTIAAVLPTYWIGLTYRNHRRRVYRLRNHLCISCGYDLGASTDQCPECGTAIPSPSPAGRGPG